jgi:hypothetical protein
MLVIRGCERPIRFRSTWPRVMKSEACKTRRGFLTLLAVRRWNALRFIDVLVASDGLSRETDHELKSRLVRIVATLTRMTMKFDGVSESSRDCIPFDDYEHEHRDAEHEHEKTH